MATFDQRVVRIERTQFLVPVGEGEDSWACWVDVEKAHSAIVQELRARGHHYLSDTDIRVAIDDAHVILYYETKTVVSPPAVADKKGELP